METTGVRPSCSEIWCENDGKKSEKSQKAVGCISERFFPFIDWIELIPPQFLHHNSGSPWEVWHWEHTGGFFQ